MRRPLIKALPDLLQRFARGRPDSLAVTTPCGTRLTAAELDAAAWHGVAHLRGLGFDRGCVIALEGEPGPAWLAALFACWRLGAIAAPLNHRQPAPVRRRDAGILGCDYHWSPSAEDLFVPAGAAPAVDVKWPRQQAVLRLCTSGSSGTPRRVELTLEQLWFNTLGSNQRLGHKRDDCWLVCLPVNHVGALAAIFRSLHNRIAVELHATFDVRTVAQRLDSGQVSLVSLVPAMLDSVLDSRGEHAFAPQLRAILLGGAACSARLLRRCTSGDLPVALSWGMTETASQVATRRPGDRAPPEEGIPPLAFVRISADSDGRLIVEGPAVCGRFVSDDIGEITAAGQVRVLGRADDVIIRGGENIHPAEIEAVLAAHPQVAEAVVLADVDARLGDVAVAFVRSATANPDSLAEWCRTHLGGVKVPHSITVLDDFPRIGPGKVDRNRLRLLRCPAP